MVGLVKFMVIFTIIHMVLCSDPEIEEEELRARAFIAIINKESEEDANRQNNVEWNYVTTLTEENLKKKTQTAAEASERFKKRWKELIKFNWKTFRDPTLKRQFMMYSLLGLAALSKEEVIRIEKIVGDMEKVYSTAKICDYRDESKCDLALEPDIVTIHSKSRDPEELKHIWKSWRDATGPHIRHLYRDYVHLFNKAARLNNFNSTDHMWLFSYEEFEIKDIRSQFKLLWKQLEPLYQQLHAFIRYRLRQLYGDVVSERGPIPAHLLGNVWGQSWINLAGDFKPFPNAVQRLVTRNLKNQKYSVEKIFRTAENFFTSLGLSPMSDSFWKKSIFTKPKNDIVCHASAWDFQNGTDFRIKMCTTITEEHFFVVHHEMGHIEYYMQYKDQPYPFRVGANPGFHEAIGDLIALSVQSSKHLEKLSLSNAPANNSEVVMNNLFEIGLMKIPFLPFSYLVDQWRWGVFSGDIPFDDYNCRWWELRENIQGVQPPVPRTEADFDPGSKYHISSSTPYIRYFVAIILEFQFHRALCEKAGQYEPNNPEKPLHLCDIYQNKEAGAVLKEMLEMGASKPWPEALYVVTGQRAMDATAILEYFHPLQTWLEKQNRDNGVHIGWDKATVGCTKEKSN